MTRQNLARFLSVILLLTLCVAPVLARNASGTRWSGVDSDGDHYIWWFQPDGGVDNEVASGHYTHLGTWTQHGNRVEWVMNKGFAHYTGVIDGRHLRGHATNIKGHSWTFDLTLDSP